jgi:hypothetical protein
VPALLAVVLLGCGGGGHLVMDLEHRPEVRAEQLPAGISRVVWAVTLDDERGDDEHYLCNVGREILSARPVPQLVREAVEAEMRVRDLRVALPDEADVVVHIVLHDFLCWTGLKSGSVGVHGKIEAELGLRLMPGQKEVYWTTLTQQAFRVPSTRREKPEQVFRRALEDVLDGFAQHVATHPDLMIRVQEMQARGELPE